MTSMTPQQQLLVLQIVSNLDRDAVTGEGLNRKCKHCDGYAEGTWYSSEFKHNPYCIVPGVQMLRETMYENCQ